MKSDLKDVTFIFPVRLDSIIRLENLVAVLHSLLSSFDTHVMVLEASAYNSGLIKKLLPSSAEYLFVQDDDPVFYRTKYLNVMTSKVTTPFLGIWDADVIIDKNQIIEAVSQLRSGAADIAYPYNGTMMDTTGIIRDLFIVKKKYSFLRKNNPKMKSRYGKLQMTGGAILVNVEKYTESGMEDEGFYGWGGEDNERLNRWISLGYTIHRSKGVLYHLYHPRDINGNYRSKHHELLAHIKTMDSYESTKDELSEKFNPLKKKP